MTKREIPLWVTILTGLFFLRFVSLSMSSFGWYHGGNEAVYSEIAYNYRTNPWVPIFKGSPFFDTGPLTTYLMAASFRIFGISEVSARLPELLAYPVLCWAAWMCGENFFGKGRGKIAALLVGTSPFVLLWFGRAQTDAWMVAGVLLFLAGFSGPNSRKSDALIVGGLTIGILAKQPALMLVPFAILISGFQARASEDKWKSRGFRKGILIFVGSILGCLWWLAMYHFFPNEVAIGTRNRPTHIAEDVPWAAIFTILGSGGLLFFSWLQTKGENWTMKDNKTILLFGILGYGIFGLFDSPVGHEYYLLPLIAVLGVFAAGWKWDNAKLASCVAVSLLITAPMLVWSGDLGDKQTMEMGVIVSKLPASANVSAPMRLLYALEIYSGGRSMTKLEDGNFTKDSWVIAWDGSQIPEPENCTFAAETGKTLMHSPLRLWACGPQIHTLFPSSGGAR